MGNQTKRSRLAPLQGSRAQWGQDFAFAVVLPLRTRPLRLELHQSSGNRRKGRTIARAYIPLATLFPEGCSESAFCRRCCCIRLQCVAGKWACPQPPLTTDLYVCRCNSLLCEASPWQVGRSLHGAGNQCISYICIEAMGIVGEQSCPGSEILRSMVAVGRDGDWFRLHDASSAGSFEGAVALAAACVDVDFRRELYGLPISVPPEQRQTR